MKQTILGADRTVFQKNIRKNILLSILVFCAVVFIHAACTLGRTEHNHTYMLLANILADILGGSFLIARLNLCILPQVKLLRLYDTAVQKTTGQVLEIGASIIHYIGVDCYEVSLPNRHLFLPVDTMTLQEGRSYGFRLKGNLIVEVCDHGQD